MPKRKDFHIAPQEYAQWVGGIALFVGFLLTYWGVEFVLAVHLHSTHWLIAGLGAVGVGGLAYGVTLWWQIRRL